MDNLITNINSLPNLKISGGVSTDEIVNAERILNVSFADDFKLYLLQFGQIQARGLDLTGISSKESTSVVNITSQEYARKAFSRPYYVIEDLGIDGILYLQNSSGQVFEYRPGRKPLQYADSLETYIKLSQQ